MLRNSNCVSETKFHAVKPRLDATITEPSRNMQSERLGLLVQELKALQEEDPKLVEVRRAAEKQLEGDEA